MIRGQVVNLWPSVLLLLVQTTVNDTCFHKRDATVCQCLAWI